MDTELHASVATFRVYTSGQQRPLSAPRSDARRAQAPPTRAERMAATLVTEGPLILSRLATNEMSYLQVNNFTRAIMPRSHIWRVSDTELVVPASFTNYWLITLHGPRQAVLRLDQILRCLCRYEVLGEDAGAADEPPRADAAPSEPPPRPQDEHHVEANNDDADTLLVPLASPVRATESARPAVTAAATGALASPPASPSAAPRATPPLSPGSTQAGLQKPQSQPQPQPQPLIVSRSARPKARLITPPEIENVQMGKIATAHATRKPPAVPEAATEPSAPAQTAAAAVPKVPASPRAPAARRAPISVSSPARSPKRLSPQGSPCAAQSTPEPELGEDLLVPVRNHSALQKSLDSRFGPRFTHPLIPSPHMDHAYPIPTVYPSAPRLALQRRELLAVGPNSLHQDVTTVGGYIGLKAVNRILRKT